MPTPILDRTGGATIVTANDDGSLDVRVAAGAGDGGGKWLTLPEANARQFATLIDLAERVDKDMPEVEPISEEAFRSDGGIDPATTERFAQQTRERRLTQYGEGSPAAAAFIEIVELLTGRKLSLEQLHPSSMKPLTIAAIIRGYEHPLGGLAEPTSPPDPPTRVPVPVPLVLDSEVDAPGSPPTTEPASLSIPTPSTG